jgi:hypothetical protein
VGVGLGYSGGMPKRISLKWAAVTLSLLVAGCDDTPWKGWAYPNRSDLTDDIALGAFKSLEECRASALEVVRRTEGGGAGDYECGYRCKKEDGVGGMNICEKTER